MEISPRRNIADLRMPSAPAGMADRWNFGGSALKSMALGAALTVAALSTTATDAFAIEDRPSVERKIEAPEQLNLPNGCAVEAAYFRANCKTPNGIVMLDTKFGQHAIVAYEREGKLWSHCSLLGDVNLKLSPAELAKPDKIIRTYQSRFNDKVERVLTKGDTWPIAETRPGDTEAIQIARASKALESAKIQNRVLSFTRENGEKTYAMLMGWSRGVAVYSPKSGTIFPGGMDFGPEQATAFAKEHLGFTPSKMAYEKADNLLAETSARVAGR